MAPRWGVGTIRLLVP